MIRDEIEAGQKGRFKCLVGHFHWTRYAQVVCDACTRIRRCQCAKEEQHEG